MNLLITSIGKRVQLIKHLKQSFKVIGVDAGELNPAKFFVHKFYKIPKASENGYIECLLDICEKEEIKVLIPLYEGEFEILHNSREEFNRIGTLLLLSCGEILSICKDKERTHTHFKDYEIYLPKVYTNEEIEKIISNKDNSYFPLIIKPRDGMGSSNVFKIKNIRELEFFKDYVENGIVQEFISGEEYTVDVLVDLKGNPIYIVPRKRIEIRAGEVVKSATIHDEKIIDETFKVIKFLNKSRDEKGIATVGPLTIQFFKTVEEKIYLLEINPRFGGGVPLSFEAGAHYGNRILEIIQNKESRYCKNFKKLTMSRYEEAIFYSINKEQLKVKT